MAIFTFDCETDGKFEKIVSYKYDTQPCPKCGKESEKIEWEVPARRNPEHGVQK